MTEVRYTLLADGTSDRVLMGAIDWVLHQHGVRIASKAWADLSFVTPQPRGLQERVLAAVTHYPCDLLFVHRDAEAEPFAARLEEILGAIQALDNGVGIPVIPVRMTEAWLLHDEPALRHASGNPNGKLPLHLPAVSQLESIPDPKSMLFQALLDATETSGRRRTKRKRERSRMRARLGDLIDDYTPLLNAPEFAAFYAGIGQVTEPVTGQVTGHVAGQVAQRLDTP